MDKLYRLARQYVTYNLLHSASYGGRQKGDDVNNNNSRTNVISQLCKKHQILRMVISETVVKYMKRESKDGINSGGQTNSASGSKKAEQAVPFSASADSLFDILHLLVYSVKSKDIFDNAIGTFFHQFMFNDFVNIFEIYNVLLSRYEASESFYVSYLVVLKYYIENIILGSIVTNDSELQMKIKYSISMLKVILFNSPKFTSIRQSNNRHFSFLTYISIQSTYITLHNRLKKSNSSYSNGDGHSSTLVEVLTFMSTLSTELKKIYYNEVIYNSFFELVTSSAQNILCSLQKIGINNDFKSIYLNVCSKKKNETMTILPKQFYSNDENRNSEEIAKLVVQYIHENTTSECRKFQYNLRSICLHILHLHLYIKFDGSYDTGSKNELFQYFDKEFYVETIKAYFNYTQVHDNKKYLSSENNSMGNLSAELATCLHVSLLFDLFQTDHHDISTVCIYDIDVHQSMSFLPSSAMATHWNCFKNTLATLIIFAKNNNASVATFGAINMYDLNNLIDDDNFKVVFNNLLKKSYTEISLTFSSIENVSLPIVIASSRDLYTKWKSTLKILFNSSFILESNKHGSRSEQVAICNNKQHGTISNEKTIDNNISTVDKLMLLYTEQPSKAYNFYKGLNAGEGRKVQNHLRNLVSSRKTSDDENGKRLLLIRLLNDLVKWHVVGAEALQGYFTAVDIKVLLSAAKKRKLNDYFSALFRDKIPNIMSISETLFRAALDCPDMISLNDICSVFQDFNEYIDLSLIFKAMKKLLLNLGSTNGLKQITPKRTGHQMIYSAIRVLKHFPNHVVQHANIFNRNISETILFNDVNDKIFESLIFQSILYLSKNDRGTGTYVTPPLLGTSWIQARLFWIFSHCTDLVKAPQWIEFWSNVNNEIMPADTIKSNDLNTTADVSPETHKECLWCSIWDEIFSLGYDNSGNVHGIVTPKICNAPLSMIDDTIMTKFKITKRQIHLPTIGILSYWETHLTLIDADGLNYNDFNIEHRDNIWNMIINSNSSNLLCNVKTLFISIIVAFCRVNMQILSRDGNIRNNATSHDVRPPRSLLYMLRSYESQLRGENSWLLDTLIELKRSKQFKMQIIDTLDREKKLIFDKSICTIIESVNAGLLLVHLNSTYINNNDCVGSGNVDSQNLETERKELLLNMEKLMLLIKNGISSSGLSFADYHVIEDKVFILYILKTIVKLHQIQQSNTLKLSIISVFQKKLGTSDILIEHIKSIVPYFLSIQESKKDIDYFRVFFENVFSSVNKNHSMKNYNKHNDNDGGAKKSSALFAFSDYEKANYSFEIAKRKSENRSMQQHQQRRRKRQDIDKKKKKRRTKARKINGEHA